MTIFLDTDTLSYFLSGNSTVINKVNEAISCGHQICLTCINVYEIMKGLKYRGNTNKEKDFHNFLTNIVVFSLDGDAIQKASDIYATLRKKGVTIGDADILIASIVIANDGKFATNNIKHYRHIDDWNIENWREEEIKN